MHKYKNNWPLFMNKFEWTYLWLYDFISISGIYKKLFPPFRKKNNGKKNLKKYIFNKNKRRCRDARPQKACEQGWESNIGPKIEQIPSMEPNISTALSI